MLFGRVRSWWDDQKDFLNGPVDFPLGLDELHRDLSGLIDILMKVILPRIEYLDEQNQTAAVKMITELDEAKINILPILPAVLPASPALYDFIAERIQAALFSNDKDQVEGALLGLRDWFVYSQKAALVKPPSHFFDHLINIVAGRKPPALDSALMYVGHLLKSVPQIFEEKHLELMLVGLDRLIEETDVRSNLDAGSIQMPDKPHVRYRAAKLAHQISQHYEQIGKAVPATLSKWQVVCQSDPIAYVRSAWGG